MSAYIGDTYKLPTALVGRADLARLVREVETVDSDLESQKVRMGGRGTYHLPNMSQPLHDFLELNSIDIADDQARMLMKEQLRKLKDRAPIVHMTFAVEADALSVQKLVAWLRDNAHPQTLLSIGLQPSLVAGVYLRTPNQVHDFTLKTLFSGQHAVMIRLLEDLSHGPQVVAAPVGQVPAGNFREAPRG
jgi:hypothetical protein